MGKNARRACTKATLPALSALSARRVAFAQARRGLLPVDCGCSVL